MSRHDGLILLLIVDEVHHFGGGLRDEALEMAMADARLGLTATAPRGAGAAARLAELVGPTVFELAVGDLAGGGSRQLRRDHAVPGPLSRGNFRLHELERGVHRGLRGVPSGGAGRQLAGLQPTRRPHPRGPSRPGGVAPDATASGIHARQAPRQYDSRVEERFAREFRRLAPEWDVVREPEPIAADGRLIFPDFALQLRSNPARRWLLEIVGFWTPDYVANKLALYRRARLPNLILCIDDHRNCAEADLPSAALVVRFRRRVDAAAVLRLVG